MINKLFGKQNFAAQSAANHKSAIQMNGIIRLKSKFKHLLSEWSGIITSIGRGLFIPLLAGLFFIAEVPLAGAQTSTHTLSMFTTPDANQIMQGANVNFRLRMSSAPGHTIRQNVTISWEPANLVTSVCGRTPTPGQTTHTCTGGIIVWSSNTESNWHSAAVSTSASALSNTNGSITATLDTAQYAAGLSNPTFQPTYDPDSTSLTVKVLKVSPPVVHLFSQSRVSAEGSALYVQAQANRSIVSTDQVSACIPGESEKCLFVDVSIASQGGILSTPSYNAKVKILVGRDSSAGYYIGDLNNSAGLPGHEIDTIDDLVNEKDHTLVVGGVTRTSNIQATLQPNDTAYRVTVDTLCYERSQFGYPSNKCKVLGFLAKDNDRVTASLSAEPTIRENTSPQVKLVLDRKPWQRIEVGYTVSASGDFLVPMPQNPTDFVVNPAVITSDECDESRNNSVPNNTTNIDAAQCVFDLPDFVNDNGITSAGGTLTVALTTTTGTAIVDDGYQTITGQNDSVSVVILNSDRNVSISRVGYNELDGITEGGDIQFKFSTEVPVTDRTADITVNYRITQGENDDFFESGFQFSRTAVLPQDALESQTVSIGTHDDTDNEDYGTVTVELLPGLWYTVGPSDNSVAYTVLDNDSPLISISAVGTNILTEGGQIQFKFTTDFPAADRPLDLTVHYVVSQGANYNFFGANFQNARTATLPNDAMMSDTVSLSTVDDNVNEPNGNVIVKLLANPSYEISHIALRNLIAFTVKDNDVPVIRMTRVGNTVSESSEFQFTLTASNFFAGESVTVDFEAVGPSYFLDATKTSEVIDSTNPVRVNVLVDDFEQEENGMVAVHLYDRSDTNNYNLMQNADSQRIEFTVVDNDDPTTLPTIHIYSAYRAGPEGAYIIVRAKSSRIIEATDRVLPCWVGASLSCLSINIEISSDNDIFRDYSPGTFTAKLTIEVGSDNTIGVIGNRIITKSFGFYTVDDLINENTPEGNITVTLLESVEYNVYSPPQNNDTCDSDSEFGNDTNKCKILKYTIYDNDRVTASLSAEPTYGVSTESEESDRHQVKLVLDRIPWNDIGENGTFVSGINATGIGYTVTASGDFLISNIPGSLVITSTNLSDSCTSSKPTPRNSSTDASTAQCVFNLPDFVNDTNVTSVEGTLTVTLTASIGATRDTNGYQTIPGHRESVTVAVVKSESSLTVSRVDYNEQLGITEGGNIKFRFSIGVPVADRTVDIIVNYEIVQGQNYDFFESGFQKIKTATLPQNSQMTEIVSIATDDDSVEEADGDVTVMIKPGSWYLVNDSDNAVVFRVKDNEDPIIMIQSNSTVFRNSAHQFTLSTSSIAVGLSVTVAFTVTYTPNDGSAYTPSEMSRNFLNSTRSKVVDSTNPVEVDILGDDASSISSDVAVTVTLTNGSGYDLATTSSITFTVTAADEPPAPTIDSSLPTVHIYSAYRAGAEGAYIIVRAKSSRIIEATDSVLPCWVGASLGCLSINIEISSNNDIFRDYSPGTFPTKLTIEVGSDNTIGVIGNRIITKSFGFYTVDDLINENTPEGNITVELLPGNGYNVYSPPAGNPECNEDSEFGNDTKKCKILKYTIYDNDRVTASLSRELTALRDSASQVNLVLDRKPWQSIHVEFNAIASGNFLNPNIQTTLTVNPDDLSNGSCDDSKENSVPNSTTDANLAQCTFPLPDLVIDPNVPSTGGTLTVALTSVTGATRDTKHYQTITGRNDSVTLTIQYATNSNGGAGGASGESGPSPSFSQVRGFDGNAASFEIPVISIIAVSPLVNEGDTVEFIISASIPPSSELSVNLNLESKGDFAVSALPTSVVLNSDLTKATIRIPTDDDNVAEDDGELTAELLEGEDYAVNPQKSMAVVTISDKVDREHRRDRVSVANRLVVSKLLKSGSMQTLNAASDRMQLAFSAVDGNTFSISGKSDVTDLISLGGNALNGDLSGLKSVFKDASFTVQLFPEEGLPIGSTFWGRSNLQELSHKDTENQFGLTGDILSGYLGADVMLPYNLLAGISTSYSEGQMALGENGREEFDFLSRTTGIHPYMGWSDTNMDAQAMIVGGYGLSELTMNQEKYAEIRSDSSFNLMGIGGSKRILNMSHAGWDGTTELAVKGNAWTAQQYLQGDGNYVKSLTVATHQSRLGIDARHQYEFNETTMLTPIVFVGMSGYEHEGSVVQNWDLVAGVEFYSSAGFEVSSTSRYLFSQVSSIEDWQLSLSVEFDYGNDGLGWQYSFSTTTGDRMIGDNTNFGEFDQNIGIDFSDSVSGNSGFNSELSYGLNMLDGIARFSPNVGYSIGEYGLESYSIGGKLGTGSRFELAVEYSHGVQSNSPDEQLIDFNGRLNW